MDGKLVSIQRSRFPAVQPTLFEKERTQANSNSNSNSSGSGKKKDKKVSNEEVRVKVASAFKPRSLKKK